MELVCCCDGAPATVVHVPADGSETLVGRAEVAPRDAAVSRAHIAAHVAPTAVQRLVVRVLGTNGVVHVAGAGGQRTAHAQGDALEAAVGDALLLRAADRQPRYRIDVRACESGGGDGEKKEDEKKEEEKEREKKEEEERAAGTLVRQSSQMQELEGLLEYSQTLREPEPAAPAAAAAEKDEEKEEEKEAQPEAKRARVAAVEEETKEDEERAQQCRVVQDVLPGVPRERIMVALAETATVDEALALLVDELSAGAPAGAPEAAKEESPEAPEAPKETTTEKEEEMCPEVEDVGVRCAVMVERFPELAFETVKRVVESTPSMKEAAAILAVAHEEEEERARAQRTREGSSAETSATTTTPLAELQEVFPDRSVAYLEKVLRRNGNSADRAAQAVLSGRLVAPLHPSAPPVPVFPVKLATHFGSPAASPRVPTRRQLEELVASLDVDLARPSQSLLGVAGRAELARHLVDGLAEAGPDAAVLRHCAACFAAMLRHEQALHADHVVFYHSYSHAHVLYEVQAVLAGVLLDAPADCAPLPRLLYRPFDGIPTVDHLLAALRPHGGFSSACGDHARRYRACAVSVSTALCALRSEAPPVRCFAAGYSCTDLSFRALLTGVLAHANVPHSRVAALADAVCALAARHGLDATLYRTRGPESLTAFAAAAAAPPRPHGHMLQIFVRRAEVDHVAYDALPYGRYSGRGPVSALLTPARSDLGAGQARLFVHPELLLGPSTRVVHYAADPAVAAQGPAFRAALRELLLREYPSYAALRQASCMVRNIPYTPPP